METQVLSAVEAAIAPEILKCSRCGIESAEHTCFIVPDRYSKPPRDTRCLACEQRRVIPSRYVGVLSVLAVVFWPLAIVTMLLHGDADLRIPIILFACLSTPLAVVAHELSHALTALALGLEVGRISLGNGRVLWRVNLLEIPIEIHAWPLSGRVAIGSANLRYLRTRVWITHLMGPMTNGVLALGTA